MSCSARNTQELLCVPMSLFSRLKKEKYIFVSLKSLSSLQCFMQPLIGQWHNGSFLIATWFLHFPVPSKMGKMCFHRRLKYFFLIYPHSTTEILTAGLPL